MSINHKRIFWMNVIKSLVGIGLLVNSVSLFSQDVNVDSPNLSFESGDLNGWEQYAGEFYQNGTVYEYRNWTPVINNPRIEVVSGLPNSSQDPIISCWDLPTNPDGIHPVRMGSSEVILSSSASAGAAMAEKLVYKFVVSENSTLLSFRFAAVMHCPESDHSGEQFPSFSVNMELKDPQSGSTESIDCGSFTIRGDNTSSDLQLVKDKGFSLSCTSSKVVRNDDYTVLKQYAYVPWKFGNVDLSDHIGKELTITILNHDCLRYDAATGSVESCNHRACGYFWAETKKLALKVKNCSSEDAEIIAPSGFEKYKWSRSDNGAVDVDPQQPNKAIIKKNQIKNGVKYICTLSNSNNKCHDITLETELQEVGVDIDFDYKNACGGVVYFSNKTDTKGDEVNSCYWEFGDGNTSTHTNPEVQFSKPGEYPVTVTVRTDMGCSMSKMKKITVRNFPDLSIDARDSVCYGESVKLSALDASSDSKFKWNTGETTNAIQVDSIRFSQQFSVEVVDEYDCVYKDSVWVNVKPAALFDVIGDNEVCLNDTISLTARAYSITSSEDMRFLWNTGETTPQIRFRSNQTDTVFTVTGTYKNGCSMKQVKTVKVNPTPTVSVSGTQEVCRGEEAVISAEATQTTGEITYIWDDIHSGQDRRERMDSTTTYTVRAVDERRCASLPKSHTVVVKPTPVLELKGDTIICEGMSTTLSLKSDNSSTIRWYDGTTGVNSITRTPSQDTTYWVEGEMNGCRAYAELTVNLWFTPSIWVDGNTSICPGETSILRVHGAHHYKWSNGQTEDSLAVQPTQPESYYTVYGYSDKGCSTSENVLVTVNPRPSLRTEGDHQSCQGALVKIEAIDDNPTGKAIAFAWDNGAIGSTIIPQINETSKFTVTAANQFGCTSSVVHEVTMTTPPNLSYQGETVVCLGKTITLRGVGAQTYTWDDGETQVTAPSLEITPTTNKKIRLTGSNASNCPSTLDIPVGVITSPTLYLTGDSAVCQGSPFTLFVSGASVYEWSTGDRTSSITYNLDESGEYTVYGTNDEGCTSVASMYVTVRPAPVVTISKGPQHGCQDKADTINLYAKGASYYQWSSFPVNESVAQNGYSDHLVAYITENTHFEVEGLDEYGCVGYAEYDIDLLPRQELLFNVYPTFIEQGDSKVNFSGITPVESKWYWEPGDGQLEQEGGNTSHFYNPSVADSFVVRVRAVDKFGCEYTGKQSIFTWIDFWAPEGFTPNGDDLNDAFKFYGGEFIDEFEYIIYNRLGEIVFEGKDLHEEWNGTINGEPCPWGVYGWYCKYKSSYKGVVREGDRRGFVSLIR